MLKAAVRSLIRQPGFACAAIATLALGIAAATALFSTVNAALLAPLPYPRAQDIFTVRTYMIDGRFTVGLVATEEMSTLKRLAPAIQSALGVRRDATITTDGTPRQIVVYDGRRGSSTCSDCRWRSGAGSRRLTRRTAPRGLSCSPMDSGNAPTAADRTSSAP
jgi:hypothetical protein